MSCDACGFVFNQRFDPATQRFGDGYEESQAHSGVFRRFERELVEDLVGRLGVRGQRVLEVGCGKGTFLRALCELGGNRGVGYDPAYAPRETGPATSVRFERRLFGADVDEPPADVVVCRHTLEHIRDVVGFGRLLSQALRPGGLLLVEAPAWERISREAAFWDVYYEHACYFDRSTLLRWTHASGFDDASVRTVYGDQYLVGEARATGAVDAEDIRRSEVSPPRFQDEVDHWRGVLRSARDRRVAIWGSGSKGVGFLAAMGEEADAVCAAVDINPHRQGGWMPGVAVEIVSPDRLVELGVGHVIAMNRIYRDEIAECLSRLGWSGELLALGDPR
ncbi:MAG: class I SAM-dependent methyltransferase [Planctomycetota bacterium]